MPIEKDVLEKKYWWCPKWYWPFAVCSGYRTVHKWCYNFTWIKKTGYLLFTRYEACESGPRGGQLYTWTEPFGGAGGVTTFPSRESCYDSSRGSSEGICDTQGNTWGSSTSPLSVGRPFVSNLDLGVHDLKTNVVETGTFEFTAESGGLCQKGLWPWKRVLHDQVITATVAIRYVTVQWYLGGIPIVGNSGTISISAFCRWPFPLPKGRSETRVVQVRYEIITDETKSTIKIFNSPVDGSYSLSVGMIALVDIREYASDYTSWSFSGETCDFDPEQLRKKEKCLKMFSDKSKDYAKSKTPKLGEPVVIFSDEIWRSIREENRENVNSLLQIISNSLQDDPETFTRAINQLEQDVGMPGISRLITIGSAVKEQKVVLQR